MKTKRTNKSNWKNALNNDEEIKELDKIKEIEKNLDRGKLVYKTNEYTNSFENF